MKENKIETDPNEMDESTINGAKTHLNT